MTFEYKSEKKDKVVVLWLSGELIDRNQANDLLAEAEELREAGYVKYALDMTNLKYINSSGLNVLITLLTRARKAGGDVVIANVSKKVDELLLITKLNTVFIIADSVDSAISKLN
ncbi:MAG: anti-sigma-factor antagonist [Bacteroidetes bacterium]|nr:MAG: anti-sigma-factor antagonist [Bacteroidota bacterium]